jgi:hypothetical protein
MSSVINKFIDVYSLLREFRAFSSGICLNSGTAFNSAGIEALWHQFAP